MFRFECGSAIAPIGGAIDGKCSLQQVNDSAAIEKCPGHTQLGFFRTRKAGREPEEFLVVFGLALLIAGWFPGEPILVLRRRADYYPDLRQILVYPGAFIVDRVQTNGAGALQDQARDGQVSLFSHYGATNPAEFFAVAAEVYFERPQRMAAEHAELYRELSRFYRVNRLSW